MESGLRRILSDTSVGFIIHPLVPWCFTPEEINMEVAVAAIALITIFCGKAVCQESPTPRLSPQKSRNLDEMREYMEYVILEEQLSQATLGKRRK
jgi:hypothetical protein